MSKTCTGFFLELEILSVEISQWLVFIRQLGCLRGIPEMGAIFEAHIFAPRRKTSLACPVQRAPKHNIVSSAKQELTHFPHRPLSQGGRRSHHRCSCSANPRLSVLAKEGRPQKCCSLLYHPLSTPFSHLLTPSFILSSSSFFCFICLVI